MTPRAGRPLAQGVDRARLSEQLARSGDRHCFASRSGTAAHAVSASRCIDLWTAGAMKQSGAPRRDRWLSSGASTSSAGDRAVGTRGEAELSASSAIGALPLLNCESLLELAIDFCFDPIASRKRAGT